jgi:hypothetical protein
MEQPIHALVWRSIIPEKPIKTSISRNILILDDYLMLRKRRM